MRVTMIRDDNIITINGRTITVDLSEIPTNIHAVQWYGESGHIERQGQPNQAINSLDDFQIWIDQFERLAYELDNPPEESNIQKKNKEIKDRIYQYKSDLHELQFNWLSASVSDGDSALAKKQQIQLDLAELKSDYDADISNIKSKYAN